MTLLIQVLEDPKCRSGRSARGIQFEEMWTKHDGYEVWERGDIYEHGINGVWNRPRDVSRNMQTLELLSLLVQCVRRLSHYEKPCSTRR